MLIKTTMIFDPLANFINDTLTTNLSRLLCVPFQHPIAKYDDVIVGVVLYRQEQFQVELFTAFPNSVVPSHRHPNVDSYEMYLGGQIEFTLDDVPVVPASEVVESKLGLAARLGSLISVPHNQMHGGKCGNEGGVFLSFQHWLNGVTPTSVGRDWDGETTGNMHKSLILHTESALGQQKAEGGGGGL